MTSKVEDTNITVFDEQHTITTVNNKHDANANIAAAYCNDRGSPSSNRGKVSISKLSSSAKSILPSLQAEEIAEIPFGVTTSDEEANDTTIKTGEEDFDCEHEDNKSQDTMQGFDWSSIEERLIKRPQALLFSLARWETKAANVLGFLVCFLLLFVSISVSVGIFFYTRHVEQEKFETEFEANAARIIEAFHDNFESKLGAINSMATSFTSYALAANQTFPFVTLPNFAARGANVRIQSNSFVLHWMPLVVEERRKEWEEYALKNRHQIDEAFLEDARLRSEQDDTYSDGSGERLLLQEEMIGEENSRKLAGGPPVEGPARNETLLDDGSGYHTSIWSFGSVFPRGDEPEGFGPYLPAWQRSPINGAKQKFLNMNWATTKALRSIVGAMLNDKTAILGRAVVPIPAGIQQFKANLALSQYRQDVDSYLEEPHTFLTYPVFDTLTTKDTRNVVGIIATNMYWKLSLEKILPRKESSQAIICVLNNSFNQTFSFRIDGPNATYLGMDDFHDPKYDKMGVSANVNRYVEQLSHPERRAYLTVPFDQNVGVYEIRVYPSAETENNFLTQNPLVYMGVVLAVFVFTSIVYIMFAFVVYRIQHIVTAKAVENANKATIAERELNEFLSHEVRNPLAAAMAACTFVSSTISSDDLNLLNDEETQKVVREDVEIIGSSLRFINDFLRSMLDIHRADEKRLQLNVAPTDLLRDVFEPVSTMHYKRGINFAIEIDCPENLVVKTDSLRLKQVVLNLTRNSIKFVDHGFVRMRADVVEGHVRIYVEDSGPGIPPEKKDTLFTKFQTSLDTLCQGTGVGLSLCKNLLTAMDGEIWLDDSYHSGVEGCPGVRFVVQLNIPPIRLTRMGSKGVIGGSSTDISETGTAENTECMERGEVGNGAMVKQMGLPQNLSVLFVDDDMVLRKLFSRAVRRVAPSWKITEAASGEMAIRLCETESFDVIFIDQYMASVEKQLLGTETVHALRARGIDSRLCGLSANDMEAAFLDAGADHFMLKPIPCDKAELEQELMKVLKQH